jgi:hypothetical protein
MNPTAFQGAIEIVRTVGDRLKSRYDAVKPIGDNDAMMAAFRHLAHCEGWSVLGVRCHRWRRAISAKNPSLVRDSDAD